MLKKTLLAVLITVSASPLVAIAEGLSGAPTPVQSYHSDTLPSPGKSDSDAMAQVKALMAKAKKEAAEKKLAQEAAPTPAQPVLAAQNPSPPSPVSQNTAAANPSDLAGQVSTLNQTNLMFQQRTDQQIEALAQKNTELTDQLSRMGQALTLLNQEVVQINSKLQQVSSGAPAVPAGTWDRLKPEFLGGVPYTIYAVLAALLVIILLMLPWYRRGQKPATAAYATEPQAQNEAEYDFMGTHEAIPAKLDLARAYLAMEDHEAAKQVLAEVQKDGNATQREEAKNLMDSILRKS